MRNRGAAGQQYSIVVGLIAVVAITAITYLGTSVRSLINKTSNTIATAGSGIGSNASNANTGSCSDVRNSCLAHLQAGCTQNQAYFVDADGAGSLPQVSVYCDMSTDGGGWTLAAKNRYSYRDDFVNSSASGYQLSEMANVNQTDGALPSPMINMIYQNGERIMRHKNNNVNLAFLKRLTNPASYDLMSAVFTWSSTNAGNFTVDFNIYSSLADLNADQNRWVYCDFDVNVGFPRNCGPNGFLGWVWFASFNHTPNTASGGPFHQTIWVR